MLKLWPAQQGWRAVRRSLVWLALAAVFYYLYLWHLENLTPGMSAAESSARSSSASLHAITQNPTFAPHKLLQLAVQSLGHHGAFWLRAVSVIFGLLFIVCLYWLLRTWFGKFIALLGTILFATSPLFMLSARSVTPNVMLASSLAVIACFVWLLRSERWPNMAWVTLCLVSSVACYTPGLIWIVAAGIVFGRARLIGKLEKVSQASLFAGVSLFLIVLVPAALAAFRDISVARQLLLIPSNWPTPLSFAENIIWSLSALFWKTKSHFDLNIGRTPLLSATLSVLAGLGFYALAKRARDETYFLAVLLAVTILALALGRQPAFSLFSLAAFALAAAAGLRYLHFEWQSVFPRNPFPRILALVLMLMLVGLQFLYGARYTLTAWPHAAETKSVYVLK